MSLVEIGPAPPDHAHHARRGRRAWAVRFARATAAGGDVGDDRSGERCSRCCWRWSCSRSRGAGRRRRQRGGLPRIHGVRRAVAEDGVPPTTPSGSRTPTRGSRSPLDELAAQIGRASSPTSSAANTKLPDGCTRRASSSSRPCSPATGSARVPRGDKIASLENLQQARLNSRSAPRSPPSALHADVSTIFLLRESPPRQRADREPDVVAHGKSQRAVEPVPLHPDVRGPKRARGIDLADDLQPTSRTAWRSSRAPSSGGGTGVHRGAGSTARREGPPGRRLRPPPSHELGFGGLWRGATVARAVPHRPIVAIFVDTRPQDCVHPGMRGARGAA